MRTLFYIALCTVPTLLRAQTITGSWYGRAEVDLKGLNNNYLTELVIKQKGSRVEGIFGYYFRDKYQSFFVHGKYNPKTKEIIILNLPVIFNGSNSTVNSIDCITNFIADIDHVQSGKPSYGNLLSRRTVQIYVSRSQGELHAGPGGQKARTVQW